MNEFLVEMIIVGIICIIGCLITLLYRNYYENEFKIKNPRFSTACLIFLISMTTLFEIIWFCIYLGITV